MPGAKFNRLPSGKEENYFGSRGQRPFSQDSLGEANDNCTGRCLYLSAPVGIASLRFRTECTAVGIWTEYIPDQSSGNRRQSTARFWGARRVEHIGAARDRIAVRAGFANGFCISSRFPADTASAD